MTEAVANLPDLRRFFLSGINGRAIEKNSEVCQTSEFVDGRYLPWLYQIEPGES
jgi:hypothetical protein